MTRSVRAANAILVVALAWRAAGASPETRQHFALKAESFGLSYSITKIVQTPNETEDRDIYLIEDRVSGDRLVVTDRRDFLNQTREVEVVDTDSKEKVISIIQFPYKSATRIDTLEEMRAERKAGIPLKNLPITIEMNGVSVTAGNDEWTSDKARDHRSKIRRAASNTFMERLERLRPILGARGELGTVCRFLIALILNHEACRGPVTFEPAKPDCQFDASFRYGCSEAQKRRVAAAKSGDKVLTTY